MNKETLKKIWKNKRWHSLVVLMLWMIGLALAMLLVFLMDDANSTISPQTNTNTNINRNLDYYDKLENLEEEDFSFSYTVTKDNEKITYEGNKIKNTITGYRQNRNGIMKYKIEDGITYEIQVDKEVEITTLYENVNASLLDISYILDLLYENKEENILSSNGTTTYFYSVVENEEPMQIKVTENSTCIENITLTLTNTTYELAFTSNIVSSSI